MTEFTKEQTAAIHATGGRPVEFLDPDTNQTYVVVDRETHRIAMEALRRQEDQLAIAEGLAQLAEGKGKPLAESFAEMRSRLGFPAST